MKALIFLFTIAASAAVGYVLGERAVAPKFFAPKKPAQPEAEDDLYLPVRGGGHRVQERPRRAVWYVDVGHATPTEVEKKLREFKQGLVVPTDS